ncbi:hypothetical protein [Prosthecobacter sp.]|uniref:hypothetical protein n=1 Tax=Prosthecobacter sp. TaxID=1965333 RepID=UPI003784E819
MNLTQNARDLSVHWHATKAHWRDAKALDFEKTYLEPLPALMSKTNTMIGELETLLRKIRKDCEQLP